MRVSESLVVFGLAFACGLAAPACAGTYKWVDDKGVTHYGDTIPPEFKDKAYAELSKRGLTVKTTDKALTPEQLRAKQEEALRAKQEEAQSREQKRRDQALLQTFSTENDIDLKRDRDLQQIDLSIANNQAALRIAEKRYAESRARAESLTRNGKPVPDGIKQEIEVDGAEKARLEASIAVKRQESDGIRAKYAEFKRRFLELQGGAATAAGNSASASGFAPASTATVAPVSASALKK
jgi:hypothetical protein